MSNTSYITVEDSGIHYTLVHNSCRLIANESYIPFDWNPLNLPPKTIRFQFLSGFDPSNGWSSSGQHPGTWTQVSSEPNVWDFYRNSSDWSETFDCPYGGSTVLFNGKMLGGNLEGVTNVQYMFNNFAGDCEGAYLYMPDVPACTKRSQWEMAVLGELRGQLRTCMRQMPQAHDSCLKIRAHWDIARFLTYPMLQIAQTCLHSAIR
jgi:hypothetical protein